MLVNYVFGCFGFRQFVGPWLPDFMQKYSNLQDYQLFAKYRFWNLRISKRESLGNMCVPRIWNVGNLKCRNFESLKIVRFWRMKVCNFRTLRGWNFETWNRGILKSWDFENLESWNLGTFKTLKVWNFEPFDCTWYL